MSSVAPEMREAIWRVALLRASANCRESAIRALAEALAMEEGHRPREMYRSIGSVAKPRHAPAWTFYLADAREFLDGDAR